MIRPSDESDIDNDASNNTMSFCILVILAAFFIVELAILTLNSTQAQIADRKTPIAPNCRDRILTELEIQILRPTSLKLVRKPGEHSLKKDPTGPVRHTFISPTSTKLRDFSVYFPESTWQSTEVQEDEPFSQKGSIYRDPIKLARKRQSPRMTIPWRRRQHHRMCPSLVFGCQQ
jgi:hypothetical protein